MSFNKISGFRLYVGKRLASTAALCVIGLVFAGSRVGQSQALPTASRTTAISGFFTGGRLETDYGTKELGFAVGGDIGFYPRFFRLLDPALEGRYTFGAGKQPTEWTFGGGLRLSKNLRKWRPYGNFGIGYGRINLALLNSPQYPYDDSVIYTLGGGVEYTVKGPFAIKADYQYQIWRLSQHLNNLTPSMYTVGVSYTIPSKAFRSER